MSFKSNKFDLKHKILLIRRLLNFEASWNVLHNIIEYFSSDPVNQITNKYLNV